MCDFLLYEMEKEAGGVNLSVGRIFRLLLAWFLVRK